MSILVDTGVLLRAFVPADPECAEIRESLRQLIRQRETLFTTAQNIAEFHNVSTRPEHARGGYGLPVSLIAPRVRFVERLCQLEYESRESYSRWKEIVARHGVVGASVHDARLVATMLSRSIDRILTLNEHDFRRYESEGIFVVTPRSLVD